MGKHMKICGPLRPPPSEKRPSPSGILRFVATVPLFTLMAIVSLYTVSVLMRVACSSIKRIHVLPLRGTLAKMIFGGGGSSCCTWGMRLLLCSRGFASHLH
jgi:hypothetical protein